MEQLPAELIDMICQYMCLEEMALFAQLNKYFNLQIRYNLFFIFCQEAAQANGTNRIRNITKNTAFFKRFYVNYKQIRNSYMNFYSDFDAFRFACEEGNTKVIKWLIKIYLLPDPDSDHDDIFAFLCENGHLNVAKWFKSSSKNIHFDNSFYIGDVFVKTCKRGYFDIAKWLTEIKSNIFFVLIEYHYNAFNPYEIAPIVALENGHLKIVKWLFKQIQATNDENKHNPFFESDYRHTYEECFKLGCRRGHVKIVKLLLKFFPQISVKVKNNGEFRKKCASEHHAITELLAEICSETDERKNLESITL